MHLPHPIEFTVQQRQKQRPDSEFYFPFFVLTHHSLSCCFLVSPDLFLCLCHPLLQSLCKPRAHSDPFSDLLTQGRAEDVRLWHVTLTAAASAHIEGRVVIRLGRARGRMCIGWVGGWLDEPGGPTPLCARGWFGSESSG